MRHGTLKVISGCMFSEKSAALVSALKQAEFAKIPVYAFKPKTDTRDADIASRGGARFRVVSVGDPSEILAAVSFGRNGLVGLDEVQFFPPSIVDVVNELIATGFEVVAAGLDTTFYGTPFGSMPQLLALADEIDKRYAVCMKCGDRKATRSQLLVPLPTQVPFDAPLVVIDDHASYEARCRSCHVPPKAPKPVP